MVLRCVFCIHFVLLELKCPQAAPIHLQGAFQYATREGAESTLSLLALSLSC